MHIFIRILKHFNTVIHQENIHKIAILILIVVLSGSAVFVYFEKNITFGNALWWSLVTMTTVGYGDISPVTTGGKIIGTVIMFLGIGLLGVFTATIASLFIENKGMENRGMKPVQLSDHFILCGWNYRGHQIVDELRADPKCSNKPIVMLADISEKPINDKNLKFIKGDINTETLKMANVEKAHTIIVLSDDNLDAYSRDAKTILNILTIKNICPLIYTCAEIMESCNAEHCKIAKADEIIVIGELSTNLLVQAALDHGITRLISELVTNRYGNDLFKIPLPSDSIDKKFIDVMYELKKKHNILCIGIEDKKGTNLAANPDNNYILKPHDQLIIIAKKRPTLS